MEQNELTADRPLLGRGAVAALLGCGIFTTIGLFSPGLVLPQLAQSFAATPHAPLLTELVGTLASFSFAVGAPFAGALSARVGCRRVIIPSLAGFAMAGAAPALLDDLWLILISRIAVGLALSGIFTSALVGICTLRPDMRVRLLGWFSVVGGAAAIVLFPIVGAVGRFGWRPAFLINLIALLAIPLVTLLPRSLGLVDLHPRSAVATTDRRLLGWAMNGLLVLSVAAGMGMLIGPIYSPIYLAATGVTDTRMLAIPVTLGSVAAVGASAAYGPLHNRLGVNGISALAVLAMGIALIVAANTSQITLFTCAIMVNSAMTALMAPNISASAIAYSSPDKSAQAIGVANGVMFGSQLAFPFIAGALRAWSGLAGVFLGFGSAMLIIGAVVAILVIARHRSATPA